MGEEFENLNVNITTEVSRIKQDSLGSVDERGRDFMEVQVCVSACAHVYMCLCDYICASRSTQTKNVFPFQEATS